MAAESYATARTFHKRNIYLQMPKIVLLFTVPCRLYTRVCACARSNAWLSLYAMPGIVCTMYEIVHLAKYPSTATHRTYKIHLIIRWLSNVPIFQTKCQRPYVRVSVYTVFAVSKNIDSIYELLLSLLLLRRSFFIFHRVDRRLNLANELKSYVRNVHSARLELRNRSSSDDSASLVFFFCSFFLVRRLCHISSVAPLYR